MKQPISLSTSRTISTEPIMAGAPHIEVRRFALKFEPPLFIVEFSKRDPDGGEEPPAVYTKKISIKRIKGKSEMVRRRHRTPLHSS
jgi:hypothetical protein